MLFLAAFKALLHNCSGSDDITVCVPTAQRRSPETQAMVGVFVNNVAIRTDLSGAPSFRVLLSRVRRTLEEALQHQDLPFEMLIKELQADRELTRRQLDRVRLRFEQRTTNQEALRLPELTIEFLADAGDAAPEFLDLVLTVVDGQQDYQCHWSYNAALFDEETIQGMTADLKSLLQAAAADPDRPLPHLLGGAAHKVPSSATAATHAPKRPMLEAPIDCDAECDLDASIRLGEKGTSPICLGGPEGVTHKWETSPFSFAIVPDRRPRRWRADGQLEFLGRSDNQLKIRGFRVEPGEIEEVLGEHPSLAQAAVAAHQRSENDVRLVAYVVCKAGSVAGANELKQFLARRLPDYMIPSAFVSLDTLPTTVSGKVDRKALPPPDWSAAAERAEHVVPRPGVEQQLATIWADVLNVQRVGAADNFFDLGGNSLLALRLISRVRSAFTIELPLVALFTSPTLDCMAEEIIVIRATKGASRLPPIVARPIAGPVEASITTEGFYILQQLMPDSPVLNMPTALRITGELDVDALLMAIREIVRRHAILRTTFKVARDGRLLQVVAENMPLDIPVEDFTSAAEASRPEIVRRLGKEQALGAFDFETGPLIRVRLLRFGTTEHVILATTHHLISDAWSMELVAHELAALYDAFHSRRPSPLPPLPAQYTDYSIWQRGYLQGEVVQDLLKYWRKKLDGLQPLSLPLDPPRKPGAAADQRATPSAFRAPSETGLTNSAVASN